MERDDRIGKKLGGYILTRRVGEGGMGVVYAAHQEGNPDEVVAVKLLHHYGDSTDVRKRLISRFLREGQAASTVTHENVVGVIKTGYEDSLAFIVMEFVDGASLGEVIDQTDSINVDKVRKVGAAIARGLAAIHSKGIVHRDIKPDNIMVGNQGVVKIADLGLAKVNDTTDQERLTASGVVVGTPLYVTPEAIRDAHRVDGAADIYSLGATLYHLLCGHPPFSGDSPYELMRAHLEKEARTLREINPQVPKWLSNLVQRCMSKKASERPNARELALCLHQQRDFKREHDTSWVKYAALVTILIACGGILGWRFMAQVGGVGSHSVEVAISTWRGSNLSWRQGTSPWTAFTHDEGLYTAAIPTTDKPLHLRSTLAGIHLLGSHRLPAEPQNGGERLALQPDLRPVRVVQAMHPLPREGLVLVAGQAQPASGNLHLPFVGTYPAVLWSPGLIRETRITMNADGSSDTAWKVVTWPSDEAYFSTHLPALSGNTLPPLNEVPPYHIVSASEFALVLDKNPPVSPTERIAPQNKLHSGIIRDFLVRTQRHGLSLPSKERAMELSAALNSGVWFTEDDRLYFHGSPESSQAILIVVPTTHR